MYKTKGKTIVLCLVGLLALNYLSFSIINTSYRWVEKDDMSDLESYLLHLNV
ncbi:hypothetical protein JYT99_01050 [bacterium AH-315-E09]|nr:hypothetical protein [bacterium AH-315-E09]